jgi:hypothetical protein
MIEVRTVWYIYCYNSGWVGFVVFGCVFAALRAAKTQPNTTNYPPTEQLPFISSFFFILR